jgi:hypothetical protein
MAGGGTYEGSFVTGTVNLARHSNVDIVIGRDSLVASVEPDRVFLSLMGKA